MGYLIVFIGGGIGAALRHGFNLAFARLLGTAFPYATLFENVLRLGRDRMSAVVFRVQKRHSAALVVVSHHRDSRRLHDIFAIFARCGVASRTRRIGTGRALCAAFGRAVDWLVCGLGIGAQFRLSARARTHSIGRMPSLSSNAMSRSRPGLGVVSNFGP